MFGSRHVRGFRVVLGPDTNVLVEMVRSEDRRIASQVVEIVHDYRHEQIQHLHITSRQHHRTHQIPTPARTDVISGAKEGALSRLNISQKLAIFFSVAA